MVPQEARRNLGIISDANKPVDAVLDCVSPERIERLGSRIRQLPGLEVIRFQSLIAHNFGAMSRVRFLLTPAELAARTSHPAITPSPKASVPEPDHCWAGFDLVAKVFEPVGPDFVRWQGGIDGYRFTRRGLVNRLAQWVSETGGGRRVDFLVWSGKLEQREEGGRSLYRSATTQGDWREAPGFRGHFSTFFGSAGDAGIVSVAPAGRLVAGPNLDSFLSGRLRHGVDESVKVRALFLQDDWVQVHVVDSRDISTDYKCDDSKGVLDLLTHLAARRR